jgi:iron complex outermembrane receptor protein
VATNVHHTRRWATLLVFFGTLIAMSPDPVTANPLDLGSLSLEELMEVQITSVSKRPESLGSAPASVFVLTSEDLRRSGVSTIPEALRLAPNLQVARTSSSLYAISARGFNNAVGNKLLVLIDGRTIYTPLFSGVFWDQHDLLLEDVDRIEVISGPGATLWGANAVNGVINIVTRSAKDTHGGLVAGGYGDEERSAAGRFGIGRGGGHVRAFGKHVRAERTKADDGTDVRDEWQHTHAGLRVDLDGHLGDLLVSVGAYTGESEHRGFVGPFEITPVEVEGWHVLSRWTKPLRGGSEVRLQAYYDHTKRDEIVLFRPEADIVDIELQHSIPFGSHHLLLGAGQRFATDKVEPGILLVFIPESRDLDWTNVFIQDEFQLTERLGVTAGVRFERNDYTDWEYLPSGRLACTLADNHFLWSSATRAIRAPSRLDREVFYPGTPPYIVIGGPDFESEIAKVFELGYRGSLHSRLSLSATGFLHDWDKLRSGTNVPVEIENKIFGQVYGVEAWSQCQVADWWRLSAGGMLLREELALQAGSTDPVGTANPNLRNDPKHQWIARSSLDLPLQAELDVFLRGVGELSHPVVDAYTAVDARVGHSPVDGLEISLIGRNLFDERHVEFGAAPSRSVIERSFLARAVWTFRPPAAN